jgi:nucleoside-diphosphate-sugar epimerase
LILVTGGTGLVGSHLLYDLCSAGHQVRVLKRPETNTAALKRTFSYYNPNAEQLLSLVEWRDADLLDVYSLLDAMEGVDTIYHCAAMVSFEKKHEALMMRTNIEGTANMVNAALERGITKFCHVSSIATLGRTEHGEPVTEETFWKSSPSNSNYSISKYGAEREVWRASEEGLDVVIVNPSIILGPGNWTQSTCNMFSKGYEGIKFYTDGTTGFIDVRDVSRLMIKLMNSDIKNQRFILNSENAGYRYFFDEMHTAFSRSRPSLKAGRFMSDLAWRMETIRSLFSGKPPLITRETARAAQSNSTFSSEKILAAFPDYKFIPLKESVESTCKFFLADRK